MRRLLILIIIVVSLGQIEVRPAEAICGCRCNPGICPGDAVIDTAKLIQFIKEYSQEVIQVIHTANINVNMAGIQLNTLKTMYDGTIRRPLQDALGLVAIQTSSKQIISMINGSTGGNSLLVANPEKFIKEAGLKSVEANYNAISLQNNLFSDSALDSIISSVRKDNGDDELLKLTQSEIPTTIQNYICDDNLLTKMATYNASQNGNVSYTQGDVETEKQNIYGQVCTGDPNSDPALAQTLLAIGRSDAPLSDQAQDEVWLRLTGGENDFTKTSLATDFVQKKAQEKKDAAINELDGGGGVSSEKICTKRDSEGTCTETAVINPGSVLRDAYSKAKTAGLDSAVKSFGTGANGSGLFDDLSGIFSMVSDAYNGINYATNIFGNLTGSIITDDNLNKARTGSLSTIYTGTATTTAPNQVYSEEELSATEKQDILGNILPVITGQLNSLSSLLSVDNSYLIPINTYIYDLTGLKQCFDNIQVYAAANSYTPPNGPYTLATYDIASPPVDELGNPIIPNYDIPPANSSVSWYTSELATITAIKNDITNEMNATIPNTKNVLNALIAQMNSSKTLSQIIAVFNNYQNLLDSDTLVSVGADQIRGGERDIFQLEYDQKKDTAMSYPNEYGIFNRYMDRCNAITSRVQAEIYARDHPEIFNVGSGAGL